MILNALYGKIKNGSHYCKPFFLVKKCWDSSFVGM